MFVFFVWFTFVLFVGLVLLVLNRLAPVYRCGVAGYGGYLLRLLV